MNRKLHFLCPLMILLFTINLSSQDLKPLKRNVLLQKEQQMETVCLDLPIAPDYSFNNTAPPILAATNRSGTETFIGSTFYDLQTNFSCMPRLYNFGDGTLSAVWTQGNNAPSYPTRGTGYNHFDQSWMATPTTRLEATDRTGWPCLLGDSDGNEYIINHIFATPFRLHTLDKQIPNTTWTEADLTTDNPVEIVWPRFMKGGNNGNTIHGIAITSPVANGGQIYEGVDGHLLYYRSLDGGTTWDIQNQIIPGLDNTTMNSNSADSYAIDVRGDVVVIAKFGQVDDVAIWKSEDNGLTWTRSVVHDFPLDNYVLGTGYTLDDFPSSYTIDPDAPDSLSIQTSDFSGAVILDNNNQAHVFYGNMYILDNTGQNSYFPATDGLVYWNESFGSDSTRIIARAIDANNNDSLDIANIDEIPLYFTSLTSFPNVGIDVDNNIYLVYSALMENFINENASPNRQHYRHLYTIASADGGETWTEPYDIINEDVVLIPSLIPSMETVFPSVARYVDEHLHLIYQFDGEPGLSVRGDEDEAGSNVISHIKLDVASTFGFTTNLETVPSTSTDIQISPNPTTSIINIDLTLQEATSVKISLYNLLGQQVNFVEMDDLAAGPFSTNLDLAKMEKGIYLLEVQIDKERLTRKVVKQ